MQMAQVGRDFFNPKVAAKLKENKMELRPGYVTSICQHEQDMLLCSEMKMKIMCSEIVLENMSAIMKAMQQHQLQIWIFHGLFALSNWDSTSS